MPNIVIHHPYLLTDKTARILNISRSLVIGNRRVRAQWTRAVRRPIGGKAFVLATWVSGSPHAGDDPIRGLALLDPFDQRRDCIKLERFKAFALLGLGDAQFIR